MSKQAAVAPSSSTSASLQGFGNNLVHNQICNYFDSQSCCLCSGLSFFQEKLFGCWLHQFRIWDCVSGFGMKSFLDCIVDECKSKYSDIFLVCPDLTIAHYRDIRASSKQALLQGFLDALFGRLYSK